MEFFVVVLIFITSMIVLALLIYYCQEYRNPKYSFTDNQRDISAIALAIGLPGLQQPGEFRAVPHPPGFKGVETAYAPNPSSDLPPPYPLPPPREYMQTMVMPEDSSDASSTSSEQIFYPAKTAAYSVAKRMSMSATAARRMSAAAIPKNTRASITADVAAFLVAKRMSRNFLLHRDRNAHSNSQNGSPEGAQKNKTDSRSTPLSENAEADLSDIKIDLSHQEKDETPQRTIFQPSENASARSSVSRIGDSEEATKSRSTSPYIPATVVAMHLKSRTARSGSPYTSLQNDNICTQEPISEGLPPAKENVNSSANPFPPKRTKPLLKPAENHPLLITNTSPKQRDPQSEDASVSKRSESLPPKYNKSRPAKRSESLPPKENISTTSDQVPLSSSEISYRSHSPIPLHTVEEED